MNRTELFHYAKLESSRRLQRLRDFLSDGNWHTTREIDRGADVCAVSTAIGELRRNGLVIDRRLVEGGKGIHEYQLDIKPAGDLF